ncbi:MAG: translation initiation factor IF-2 [Gemmataceae bacterium]|nr:translation initiation factor IF-2 [Gemmataceae bacterium]
MSKEKIRVYALARDLNVESKDLLEMCKQAGFEVKNQLSNLEVEQAEALKTLLKSPKSAAAPAAPAKSVMPTITPEAKPVRNLAPVRPKRELQSEYADGDSATVAEESAAPAPAEIPAPAVAEVPPVPVPVAVAPAPVAPPVPAAPKPAALPSMGNRMPNLNQGSRSASPRTPPPVTLPPKAPPRVTLPPKPVTLPPAASAPAAPAPDAPMPAMTTPAPVPEAPAPSVPAVAPPVASAHPVAPPPVSVPPRPTTPQHVRPALPTGPQRMQSRTPMNLAARVPPTLKPGATPASPPTGGGGGNAPAPRVQRPLRQGFAAPPMRAPAPAPQSGSPAAAKPIGPAVLKPIARFTAEQLVQKGPVSVADLMRPQVAAGAPGAAPTIEDEDEKGKKGKGGIPGRDQRQKDRNERAVKRKQRADTTIELKSGELVILDPQDRGNARTIHRLKKKQPGTVQPKGPVVLETPISVRSLSEAIGVPVGQLLFKLMAHGVANPNINSAVDQGIAELLAIDFGREIYIKKPRDAEDELLEDKTPDTEENLVPRAPIVTIMGHVDHGKTSLLDKIRRSNVVATEAGGITQVIRAWRVEHNGRPITFLDTPGHEAFTKMRARGANVTDIAVIVVAADDGVMPQTEEAISHAKAAGVSLVVAINKVDMPSANINRTRQQLYGLNVLPDDMGGDAPFVETSAATGKGIDELLEQISLVAELKELKANPDKLGKGTVLEAMLSEGEGVRATLLVREGTLQRGDVILCGHAYGRIRQMYDDKGQPIEEAGPSVPVRITGLDDVPNADDPFIVVEDVALAREIAEKRKSKLVEAAVYKRPALTLETLGESKIAELKLIVKADFRGSIEAIKKELEKFEHKEVRIRLLHSGIGAITESDVQLALTSPEDTMVVGFNAVPDDRALVLAEEKGIKIGEYDIIYNLTNDIRAALEGKLKPREEVVHLGRAMVRDTFKISRVGTIAGCYVTQGTIKRNARIRVIREGAVIYPPNERIAGLDSLKRFKDDSSEVREGFECGIKVAGYDDIKVGDVIEAYRIDIVQRTLDK